MSEMKTRLAWAVSGQGRSLRAVLQAASAGLLSVEIVFIVADRPSPIEDLAARQGIDFRRLEPSEGRFHPRLVESLAKHSPEWMGLTFNHLLADSVIAYFGGRIFNLHLSLLPMFPGFGALSRTINSGMRMTGATLHLVDDTADLGPVLAQATCPVSSADTRESLGRRLFDVSLPILLQLIRSISDRELTYSARDGLSWPRTARVGPISNRFPGVDPDLVEFADAFCAGLHSESR